MNALEIAPSTIEVGKKSSVELDPFQLKRRRKRKEDFTNVVGAIASGNPEAALEYEAEYGLDDDFADDQEAIQVFVALQQAAGGDKNAAMSLFNNDLDLYDSISRLNSTPKIGLDSNPLQTDPLNVDQYSYTPSENSAPPANLSNLSRQGLALGGFPSTAPVNLAYLEYLKTRPSNEGISVAAQAGVAPANAELFKGQNQTTDIGTTGYVDFAEQAASMQAPAERTSAGATLAAVTPSVVTGAMTGNVDFQATALNQLSRSGPNTATSIGVYSNLGSASKALSNPNLDLTNINTMAGLANLGMNAANTISNLSNLDLSSIPGEVTGFFDRTVDFFEDLVKDPIGVINSALDMTGTAVAYGRDITAPVSVQAVPDQPFAFDRNSLEVSTKPGFVEALFALAPSALGVLSRGVDLVQNRNVNQLSDFSKAKSAQAWDMVAAATEGQMSISDAARGAGVSSLGVGFTGMMSANINGINVSFDPFSEQPANTITSFTDVEFQLDTIDPVEVIDQREEIEATVEALSSSIKNDPEQALSYATNVSNMMGIGFESMNTRSFSQMDIETLGNPSYADPTDLAAADYGAAAKEAVDRAKADYEAGRVDALGYAQAMNAAAAQSRNMGGVARGYAKSAISALAQPAFGTFGYYEAQRQNQIDRATELEALGQDGAPGSFGSIGQSIAEDYNSQNPSPHTIDVMNAAGLNRVSVNTLADQQNKNLLGFLSLNGPTGGFGAPGAPGAPGKGQEGLGYGYGYGVDVEAQNAVETFSNMSMEDMAGMSDAEAADMDADMGFGDDSDW